MSNQIKIFMAQKQKLKSERGSLNVGIKDMFMTMDPEAFRKAIKQLAELRDNNKSLFNLVLEQFEELKTHKPTDCSIKAVEERKHIRRDKEANQLLSFTLSSYWQCQESCKGGYFWHMMPTQKANESEAQFDIRRKRMEDNLMQVMLEVLDDCDYYIKGTQNSQKTQK